MLAAHLHIIGAGGVSVSEQNKESLGHFSQITAASHCVQMSSVHRTTHHFQTIITEAVGVVMDSGFSGLLFNACTLLIRIKVFLSSMTLA